MPQRRSRVGAAVPKHQAVASLRNGPGHVADQAALEGSLNLDVVRDDPMPRRGCAAQGV
jgi:hypothetical protein